MEKKIRKNWSGPHSFELDIDCPTFSRSTSIYFISPNSPKKTKSEYYTVGTLVTTQIENIAEPCFVAEVIPCFFAPKKVTLLVIFCRLFSLVVVVIFTGWNIQNQVK